MFKNYIFNIALLLLIIPVYLFAADVDVNANITQDTYWTANNTYILQKLVYVESGASLFIEAGTVIKGAPGQEADAKALIVCRGAKIFAEGTATKPIIFTAQQDDPENPFDTEQKEVGLWGGVVLLGNAPTNHPDGETHFEGIDPNDLTLYGGDDPDDCSGVLRYVSIRHGGTQIGAGKEINGLSMAAVGKGTVISHVEVYSNKDDAFEWWGGTVRCDHLVAAFCQDDAIDLDEGNQSKMQYLFVIQDVNGDAADTRIGEHDGCHSNNIGGAPDAYPVIYNATYLGAGKEGAEANYIFRLRENWGGVYKNSIFGDFNGKAVRIDSATTPDAYNRLQDGELIFNNNIWFDISAGEDWESITNASWTSDYFSNTANKNVITDPQLAGISRTPNSKELDPRPAVDGSAYEDLADLPDADDFFEYAPYNGAFGPTNWMKGWTALDHYGYLADDKIQSGTVNVSADITEDTHWTADNQYILEKLVYVKTPATLFIEAGTVIKGQTGQEADSKALIVARGAKIMAEGTGNKPIIFTAASDNVENPNDVAYNAVGLWGGLVILGAAYTNHPDGETHFEGIDPNDNTLYGGDNDDDCSGTLRYISIRHGGTQIGAGKEINALSLAAVGSKTTLSYIEAYSNKDDAIEWWGGKPRCDHLVAALCQDDAIDLDEGNRSMMQYVFVIQDQNGDAADTRIGEHDGCHSNNIGGEPTAYPMIVNATYLGAGKEGTEANYIFRLRENWGGEYLNGIFGDFNGKAVRIDSSTTPDSYNRLQDGEIIFNNNLWWNIAAGDDWVSLTNAEWTAEYFNDSDNKNDIVDPQLASIGRKPSDNGLNPLPSAAGPAWDDINTTPLEKNNDFFEWAPYKGAFGITNWLQGWTALEHYGIVKGCAASIERINGGLIAESFALEQNYPNPFNPVTKIDFSINKSAKVELSIYNILGQRIVTLVNDNLPVGKYSITFDASDLSSGTYIYRLKTDAQVMTRKMVLIK